MLIPLLHAIKRQPLAVKAAQKTPSEKDLPSVAIAIPVHNPVPDPLEKIAIQQCLKVLGHYPIYLFGRTHFPFDHYQELCEGHPNVQCIRFAYGAGIMGFNRLLMDEQFYARFLSHKHLLIYHTDAFVFRDELPYWCSTKYDYIGAVMRNPAMVNTMLVHSKYLSWLHKYRIMRNTHNGCGGFSLRKVESFYWHSHYFKTSWTISEDLFWAFRVPSRSPFFRVPPLEKMANFGYDNDPRTQFEQNQRVLPFGCHSWHKYDPDFWKPIIEQFGYQW